MSVISGAWSIIRKESCRIYMNIKERELQSGGEEEGSSSSFHHHVCIHISSKKKRNRNEQLIVMAEC